MASFIKMIKPLKEATNAAKTNEEANLCRVLANSISDGSSYAWKMFYSDEAATKLSKKSFEAL